MITVMRPLTDEQKRQFITPLEYAKSPVWTIKYNPVRQRFVPIERGAPMPQAYIKC